MNRKETSVLISQGNNNTLKCSKGQAESLSHKLTKFWVANYCWEKSLDFSTEVVFRDNKRADVVIKDWKIAIEVLGTEKIKSFMNKSYKLPTIPIPAMMDLFDLKAMMDDLEATNGEGADYYIKKYTVSLQTHRPSDVKCMDDMIIKHKEDLV